MNFTLKSLCLRNPRSKPTQRVGMLSLVWIKNSV